MSTNGVSIAFVRNTLGVMLYDLKAQADDRFITNAAVSVTIRDRRGDEVDLGVTDQDWPLAMSYVAGSNATYAVTVPDTLALVEGQRYAAVVRAVAPSGDVMEVEVDFTARRRRN